MAQYYGVVRSDDELMHSGVRGMRWGIRKKRRIIIPNARKSQAYYQAEYKLLNAISPDQNEEIRQKMSLTSARENQFERIPNQLEQRMTQADEELRRVEAQEGQYLNADMPQFRSQQRKKVSKKKKMKHR